MTQRNMIPDCDQLRPPHVVCQPDERQKLFVKIEPSTGKSRPRTIEDQYKAISSYALNSNVPEKIATHFETARNLYLYAWFVYRFYSVAEQHVLATLELSLRERFPDFVARELKKPGFGLRKLLNYAVEHKYLKNELITVRERWAWERAEARLSYEKSLEMIDSGLTELEWSQSEVVITQEDLDYDWIKIFQEKIPKIRNRYAHGSEELSNVVLHTFEIVVELVNQLYPEKN